MEIQKLEKEEFKESKKEKAKRIGFNLSFVLSNFIFLYHLFLYILWMLSGYFEFCYLKPLSGYFLFISFGFILFVFFFFKWFFQKIGFGEFCEERESFLIFLLPVISIFSFLFSTFSPLFSPALSIFKIKETYFTVQLCFTSLNLIGLGFLTRKLCQNYKSKISFIILVILAFPCWVTTLLMPPNVVIHFWLYTSIAITWVFYTQKFCSKKRKHLSLWSAIIPLMMISLFVVCASISSMGIVYISAKNALISHFSLEKKTPAGERIYALKEVGDPYQRFLEGFLEWWIGKDQEYSNDMDQYIFSQHQLGTMIPICKQKTVFLIEVRKNDTYDFNLVFEENRKINPWVLLNTPYANGGDIKMTLKKLAPVSSDIQLKLIEKDQRYQERYPAFLRPNINWGIYSFCYQDLSPGIYRVELGNINIPSGCRVFIRVNAFAVQHHIGL